MKLFKYKDFINESNKYISSICKIHGIQNYTINSDGSVDVDGDVLIRGKRLTEIPLNFRNVTGIFNCGYNFLTSLEGCPQKVGQSFDCDNNQLTSLEGCPQSVGGYFSCSRNQLTSLKGCTQIVKDFFGCGNNNLNSLEGCPENVGGEFYCSNNKITNFKGFPEYHEGYFDFYGNPVVEILDLFEHHKKSIDWINEHDVIQGNKVILQRLEEVAYELKMDLPENLTLKNYEII